MGRKKSSAKPVAALASVFGALSRAAAASGRHSRAASVLKYVGAAGGGLMAGATAAHLLYTQGHRVGIDLRQYRPAEVDETNTPESYDRAEPGRGRLATSPLKIPFKGWIDILWRTAMGFFGDRVSFVAGGITFFMLLALFPAIGAFVTIYGLFANPSDAWGRLDFIYEMLPGNVAGFLGNEMSRLASNSTGTLTFTLIWTLLLSLWAANGGVKTLFYGLNLAYHEVEKRSIVKYNLLCMGCTISALLAVMLTSLLVVGVPVVIAIFGLQEEWAYLSPLRWPVLFVVFVGFLNLIYRIGPSRTSPRWRWLTPGATVAAVLSLAVSLLFSWFLTNFVRTDSYGPLSAAMGFLLWTWISLQVVLMGARLNAEIEHQTAIDTTVGKPKPLGERGAVMADSVGARRGNPAALAFTLKYAESLGEKMVRRRRKSPRV
ncbi:YihY/virulence factor BrkB family protein [Brevundimonas pishanensis]|uniref:YihY/virulence factor BrkB family protein n=1 Tax=Brevundimonas pishanensis TaxID=2896315 RepID=UPI001FA7C7F6|nr:YihY/virulence factor BrkB family protein [Brevundimonas pishanensis]